MPWESTRDPRGRHDVARIIKSVRSAIRRGDCRAARNLFGSVGAMAMDISDLTFWRLKRQVDNACPIKRRRR